MKYMLLICMFLASFAGAQSLPPERYIIHALEGVSTAGNPEIDSLAGPIILGSSAYPIPFLAWDYEDTTVLIPLTLGDGTNSNPTPMDSFYYLSQPDIYAYWLDSTCTYYLAVSMFEQGSAVIRRQTAEGPYPIYKLQTAETIISETFYTTDTGSCEGPFTDSISRKFALVVGHTLTFSGNMAFTITPEHVTNDIIK